MLSLREPGVVSFVADDTTVEPKIRLTHGMALLITQSLP